MRRTDALRTLLACILTSLTIGGALLPSSIVFADDNADPVPALIDNQKFEEAMSTADSLVAKAEAQFGPESPEYATALSRKGAVLYIQGRVGDAEPIFNRVLEIFRRTLPADHPDVATALNNIGMLNTWLGRYSEAPPFLQEALQIREKSLRQDDPQIAESLSNLAFTYIYLNRAAEAVQLSERAKKIMDVPGRPSDRRFGTVLQNLASALEYQGDYNGAETNLKRAVVVYKATLPDAHPLISGALTRLALTLMLQGNFEAAEKQFREAKALFDAAPLTLATPASFTDFAVNQIHQRKFAEAVELLNVALEMRAKLLPADNPEIARTLSNLAEAHYQLGHRDVALEMVRKATGILADRIKSNDWYRLNFLRHVKYTWAMYSSTARDANKLFDEAFKAGQQAARTETAVTVSRMGARVAARDPKLKEYVRQIDDLDEREPTLEQRMTHHLALPPKERTEAYAGLRNELSQIQIERKSLMGTIAAEFPDYAKLVSPTPSSTEEIVRLLAPDEALVFLLPSYDATYIWAISSQKKLWTRVDLTLEDARAWVRQLRAGVNVIDQLVEGKKPPLFDIAFAHELYLKLFAPIEPVIGGKSHLLVVASRPLDEIPFHLLVKDKPPIRRPTLEQLPIYQKTDWLLRSYAFSVLPSVPSLHSLRGNTEGDSHRRALIGFANPQFSPPPGVEDAQLTAGEASSRSTDPVIQAELQKSGPWANRRAVFEALRSLKPLEDTETEVKTVARYLGVDQSDLVLESAASETAVKTADLSKYRTVYFATHGLKAQELPGLEEPALVLSIPAHPSDLDDGLLTASEISDLRLDADWVVLSSCNSASGRTPDAEGLSGLAQAFFHAGARSLLVSHWSVPSEAAVKLTTKTFEILESAPQVRRSEALRRSMIALIDDPSFAMNPYPTFWAPFVLVGDGN